MSRTTKRQHVVSFRLTDKQHDLAMKDLEEGGFDSLSEAVRARWESSAGISREALLILGEILALGKSLEDTFRASASNGNISDEWIQRIWRQNRMVASELAQAYVARQKPKVQKEKTG